MAVKTTAEYMNRATGQPQGTACGYDWLVRAADKQAHGGCGKGYGGAGMTTPALFAAWIRGGGCPIDSKPAPLYQSVKELNTELAAELSEEDEDEDKDAALWQLPTTP